MYKEKLRSNLRNRRGYFAWLGGLGLFLAAGFSASHPGIAAPATDPTLNLSGYSMTYNETFGKMDVSADGPNGRGTNWIAHTPWHGDFGNDVFDNPGPNGPFVMDKDGLTIIAHKDPSGLWHSGLLCSMDRDGAGQHGFAQRYGYFEMKAILPGGPGTWPAFWLIGVDKSSSSAEIDVVEYYGESDRYFHSVEHLWKNGSDVMPRDHMQEVTPGLLSIQFNTYGVLIEPDTTRFYFNRELIWSTPTPPQYQQPMYMLVNLAIGGGWPIKDLKSPQLMKVQYIRVYQKNPNP
jgi:hypothetical protein